MENVPGQNGVLTFTVFVLSLSLHVQGYFQFCVSVYYHMFGKFATVSFCPRMYAGGECSCFPKISDLSTQEPRFLEDCVFFSNLCNETYKGSWIYCVYFGLIPFQIYSNLCHFNRKISKVHILEFVSIKTWKHLYISQYRLLIHPMEGWCLSSRAGSLQCPMFAGQSSET